MARKRKTEARLDEADRTLYSTFCGAANSLSQVYSQAMSQQKLSFQAGERQGLEKLYQWILRKHEEESRLSVADIVAHIQHEMDYGYADAQASPRLNNQSQSAVQFTNSSGQISSGVYGQPAPRVSHFDQTKNTVFANALASPIRRTLQSYQPTQGGGGQYANGGATTGNGSKNNEANPANLNRDTNSGTSNDTSMDMISDSPAHEYY